MCVFHLSSKPGTLFVFSCMRNSNSLKGEGYVPGGDTSLWVLLRINIAQRTWFTVPVRGNVLSAPPVIISARPFLKFFCSPVLSGSTEKIKFKERVQSL